MSEVCEVCKEAPATQDARYVMARICAGCAEGKPGTGPEDALVAMILGESDAVCEGCGANPHPEDPGALSAWFFDLVVAADGTLLAVVRCPACRVT
jgi:hypothetical protein